MRNDEKTLGRFRVGGETVTAKLLHYCNGGGLAVELQCEDGERFAVLSVNIPGNTLPRNHFWAKTWSENEAIRQPALDSGLFVDTGERTETGFAAAELWRIS